jgi:undecaprenyl-diphosphatase
MPKLAPSRQWLELDERLCICFNRAARLEPVRQFFRIVSRLGNGVFWYVLMGALLAVHGVAAVRVVLHTVIVGLMCTLL